MKVQILHHPGCPNYEKVRRLLRESLAELHLSTHIEDREGPYPSPTILVDGMDVMGGTALEGAMCRLDVPTRERVLAALRKG